MQSMIPVDTDKRPKAQVFELYRMLPPTNNGIKYYFSLQSPKNFRKETFIDQTQKKFFVYSDGYSSVSEDLEDEYANLKGVPQRINLLKPTLPSDKVLDRTQVQARPRQAFNTMELTRPATPWTVKKSFWSKYKYDTDTLLA